MKGLKVMNRYTYKDLLIAEDYINQCMGHFGTNNISRIHSFVKMNYNRGNLTFNEYLACLDILKDKER